MLLQLVVFFQTRAASADKSCQRWGWSSCEPTTFPFCTQEVMTITLRLTGARSKRDINSEARRLQTGLRMGKKKTNKKTKRIIQKESQRWRRLLENNQNVLQLDSRTPPVCTVSVHTHTHTRLFQSRLIVVSDWAVFSGGYRFEIMTYYNKIGLKYIKYI